MITDANFAKQSPGAGIRDGTLFRLPAGAARRLFEFLDFRIPEDCRHDAELVRRTRLISRFGTLGALFGVVASVVYLLIGHFSGAAIIIVGSLCFAATPFLIRGRQSLEPAGHLLVLILTLGFTAMFFAEGGRQGHAIAWLVSVPLCALLLLGQKVATRWAMITFFAAGTVVVLDLYGIGFSTTYDKKWNPIVSAAGYMGLLVFMFVLGLIFEAGRARAFVKMQESLAALARANEQLQHLNKEKNTFMGIAAHDLRNPLMVILGNAEAAGELGIHPEINKFLGHISGAAIHMRDLVAELLDVNAIEEGQFVYRVGPCDVGLLVTQSVNHNTSAAVRKAISIQAEAATEIWARANSAALLQILDNLISNALKFSRPHTTVYVHALTEQNCVLIVVRDEGPGISEPDQKKLYQKYSVLSAQPTGGESSTGLGLAIVKRLAEGMSGTIYCQSILGQGATFTLRLPACSPDAKWQTLPPRPQS